MENDYEENDYDNLVVECYNCHLKFYISDLKIDPKTDTLICKNCFSLPGGKVTVIKDRLPKKSNIP